MKKYLTFLFFFFISYAKVEIEKEVISLKHEFLQKVNDITPSYLQFDQNSSALNISLSYDTIQNRINTYSSLTLKLISLKVKREKHKKVSSLFTKFTPLITLEDKKVKLIIKNTTGYKTTHNSMLYGFVNYFYYYPFELDYKDLIETGFKIKKYMFKISLYFYKELPSSRKVANYYTFFESKRSIFLIGLENSGHKSEYPLFKEHKLFFSYIKKPNFSERLILTITPYLQIVNSKKNYALFLQLSYKI